MTIGNVSPSFGWETLNAYVDGELEAGIAAAVASAVAADPSLARRIATLSRLKASVSAAPNEETASPARQARSAWWRLRALPYAAALLLLIGAGLIGWQFVRPQTQPAWLADALMVQRQWIDATSQTSSDPDRIVIAAKLADRTLDLSGAELRLVYAVSTGHSAARGKFLGYRGPHGCLVGLWMGPTSDKLPEVPKAMDRGDVKVRVWRHGTDGFALLSRGMNPMRLDRLAEIIASLTDPSRPVDDAMHVALRDASRVGAACRV